MSPGGVEKQTATMKICLACNREFQEPGLSTCPHDGTSLIALKSEDEFIGQTLAGKYDVTEQIGKGGMGVVYKANQQMLDRVVAIKMLQAELVSDENSNKRFQQEAKAASCLSHPHIITLYDYGVLQGGGQPYLVMEYLEGVPLIDEIRGRGPLDPFRAVKIFSEVADGLYHAHTQGIVHRDLKPSNIILVERDGDPDFVKIVDFGLAKLMPWSGKESQHLTKTGEVFGSPIYMSPEQCMGKTLGPTSDIYSLGITLFEALVGTPPFRGSNSIQTASMHMQSPRPRFSEKNPAISLPENLERVVLKTIEKEPDDRFQNMAEFKDALQAAVYNDAAIEIPPSLMVSRHAIPALGHSSANVPTINKSSSGISAIRSSAGISAIRSSAAVPTLKDQSETRLLTQLGAPGKDSGPNKALLLGGIVAAALAIGGAGAWVFMNQAAHTLISTSGKIWYYNKDTHEVLIHNNDGNHLLKYDNEEFGSQLNDKETDSQLGRTAPSVKFTGTSEKAKQGTLTDVLSVSPDDTDESSAYQVVSNFLGKMAGNDPEYSSAEQLITPDVATKMQQMFPKGLIVLGHMGEGDSKPAHAAKIVQDDPNAGIVFLVDKISFLVQPVEGLWRFTVRDGKITSIEDVGPTVWNEGG